MRVKCITLLCCLRHPTVATCLHPGFAACPCCCCIRHCCTQAAAVRHSTIWCDRPRPAPRLLQLLLLLAVELLQCILPQCCLRRRCKRLVKQHTRWELQCLQLQHAALWAVDAGRGAWGRPVAVAGPACSHISIDSILKTNNRATRACSFSTINIQPLPARYRLLMQPKQEAPTATLQQHSSALPLAFTLLVPLWHCCIEHIKLVWTDKRAITPRPSRNLTNTLCIFPYRLILSSLRPPSVGPLTAGAPRGCGLNRVTSGLLPLLPPPATCCCCWVSSGGGCCTCCQRPGCECCCCGC